MRGCMISLWLRIEVEQGYGICKRYLVKDAALETARPVTCTPGYASVSWKVLNKHIVELLAHSVVAAGDEPIHRA